MLYDFIAMDGMEKEKTIRWKIVQWLGCDGGSCLTNLKEIVSERTALCKNMILTFVKIHKYTR
jgi:hypothetical protein